MDGLPAVDETVSEAIAAVGDDDLVEAQRLLQRAGDDLEDLAGQADGELADALEDYAAVIRAGDDADALLPASDQVRTQCLLAAADAG